MTTQMSHPLGGATRADVATETSHAIGRDVVIPHDLSSLTPAPARTPSRWLAVLRIAVGGMFLWPFLDKLFGLGYATPGERAWLEGASPTNGFLSRLDVGPAKGFFHSIAGAWWADWAFMIGLGAIGIAVIAGVGLRVSAVAGSLMMMLMWLAEWPLARFTDSGDPTMSTNPVLDSHVIYALALIAVAVTAAGTVWGLGKKWASLPLVQRNPWLK